MKITTKEIYNKIGTVIIETNNLKIEEDYNGVDILDLVKTSFNIFKFGNKKDEADFFIFLFEEFGFSFSEKEKLKSYINNK